MDPISIHFHEIALKGKNRASFERRLQQNLQTAIAPLGELRVRRQPGGLLIDGEGDAEQVASRTLDVCGVAYAMRVTRHPSLEGAAEGIVQAIREQKPANFRITAKRRDKGYALSSTQVNQQLGKAVQDATGLPVRLHDAELEAHVLVMGDEFLVGTRKQKAVGGLPVGTAGKVVQLLSGGIDSPVAAWRMMRRGCRVDFVHFHSYPRVDRATIEKAEELVERLTRWQYRSRLFLVPLIDIQTAVRLQTPEKLRVLLYRRFMVRLAQKIAFRHRGRALVTGESVGQVASQTLQNIAAVDAVAKMPIFRPLCGMDKQEIIEQAQRIGTFETSILPDQDCCQLFLPPHPTVASTDAECALAEQALDVDGLVKEAISKVEVVRYRWPQVHEPVMGSAA